MPDLLPLIPKGNPATTNYDELMKPAGSGEEQKAAADGTPAGAAKLNYDDLDTA